jgi:aminoglycoside phosphotransferase family enzyme/predicted kinase
VELARLIGGLSRADAYAGAVANVEVRQTHISVVFLAGPFAYKVKKPIDAGFLDFRDLTDRRRFCEEEVRLNRRLAPAVYLGVVPVTCSGAGVRMEGEGEAVEWAVKMRRLPDEASLKALLRKREVRVETVERLAHVLARFHAGAEAGERVSSFGRFDVVAGNARENFRQSLEQVGSTVSAAVYQRLRTLTEERLRELRPLIEARADRGVPRDGHGDLRLDHVYLLPEPAPPPSGAGGGKRAERASIRRRSERSRASCETLLIIDCIEFNERFRRGDPIADIAFLVMDLLFHGRRDLAQAFADSYLAASGDEEGRRLLGFYTAYRAVVRAKVAGIKAREEEVSPSDREAARQQARGHWLLALRELEAPERRPCLLLVGGLPGSGKSTLARGLAEQAAFSVIRSDVVRKELANAQEDTYSPERTEKTYLECLRRAEELLFAGERVIVDATFRQERMRRLFLDAARAWGVPGLLMVCEADPEEARARLASRRGGVSDADWAVRQELAASWEPPGADTAPATLAVSSRGSREETLARAAGLLARLP